MPIVLKVCDRNTFCKSLDQDWVSGWRLERKWEMNIFVTFKHFIELIQILFFNIEINLVCEGFFHWLLPDRNFVTLIKKSAYSAYHKQNVYVSLNILINIWMANFYCYFLAVISGLINLTYRTWCNGDSVKLFEYLIYLFSISIFETFFSLLETMSWSILS
jgi:hypothetical protein